MAGVISLASSRGSSRASRSVAAKVDKVDARRVELAEATLETLAELGYARTSLREIANNSQFSHGVLHYYFNDKIDLICCAVRYYKETCSTRYDTVVTSARSAQELLDGFCAKLRETLTTESRMHRLWYDLRSQALFEETIREDVKAIDRSLENMVWRVAVRFAELSGETLSISPVSLYALMDGLFQQALLSYLGGDKAAADRLIDEVRRTMPRMLFAQA